MLVRGGVWLSAADTGTHWHPRGCSCYGALFSSRASCRHCPYGHWNVKITENRKNVVKTPTLLPPARPQERAGGDAAPLEVVFWSGGKDSYMALLERQRLHREAGTDVRFVLLVSFAAWSQGCAQR